MKLREVRQKYLDFFKSKGHKIIPSASLVPENDPTTLFTGSGMQPMIPYLLGEKHPLGTRIADSQKSFRSGDIDDIGDNRHTTFFEMLGNWSLGDYFKKEQVPWMFEFLTDVIGIDPNKLYVTVFIGDEKNSIPKDTETAQIWKDLFASKGVTAKEVEIGSEANGYEIGMQDGRIFYYDVGKNWWSRSGVPNNMPAGEPGGPDTEMFYEFTDIAHDPKFGKNCHPNCDCGRFMEIGNNVFMEYKKNTDGTFSKLPQRNVDFGGGLERIVTASNNVPDVFEIDIFKAIIEVFEKEIGVSYNSEKRMFRIIADHMRASVFLIADGVRPSPNERGYLLRRLLRRATLFCRLLNIPTQTFLTVIEVIIREYKDQYDEIEKQSQMIREVIEKEVADFEKTIDNGMREIEKITVSGGMISGVDAFTLATTHGFPIELTKEYAKKFYNAEVDMDGYNKEMDKHRLVSRAGIEQKFRGGLADTAEKTVRLHTAHHLLLRALQIVLGPEVHQRGSNITQERLRIDFSYGQKMTDEQKKEVEKIVNEKIEESLPVIRSEMSRDTAEALGAEHEFGQKYPDMVSVYSVGPKDATQDDPKFDQRYSIEFCGGPHVSNTSELAKANDEGKAKFKILKEEAVASGIRRIKAVLQ